MWVMLGLLGASVLVLAIGMEYQRGWESTPEPLRSWLLARTYPSVPPQLVIVKTKQRSQLLKRRVSRRLHALRPPLRVIAIAQNDRNASLQVAADTVAALLVAGVVTNQTKAIKAVWDVSPSGTNAEYARVVAAIKAAKERRTRPTYAPLKDGQQQPLATR